MDEKKEYGAQGSERRTPNSRHRWTCSVLSREPAQGGSGFQIGDARFQNTELPLDGFHAVLGDGSELPGGVLFLQQPGLHQLLLERFDLRPGMAEFQRPVGQLIHGAVAQDAPAVQGVIVSFHALGRGL